MDYRHMKEVMICFRLRSHRPHTAPVSAPVGRVIESFTWPPHVQVDKLFLGVLGTKNP